MTPPLALHHIHVSANAHDSLNCISAALLTVESLQTSAQSLFELSRQTRINFSTVENSMQINFFLNMANAEKELNDKWKEFALNK